MWRVFFLVPFLVAACVRDETISAYAEKNAIYELIEINNMVVSSLATIQFPSKGKVTGQGPCNRFNAKQSAPYPWINLSLIESTELACPKLTDERQYFESLGKMTLAEVSGDVLILSNDEGDQMVFQTRRQRVRTSRNLARTGGKGRLPKAGAKAFSRK
ncbi:META domain-containing protein [Parasulfitobacter algicola]|uniref:META domain-containing protein n=1 Tax=Parasulfitobacter algicola TaxID=2614809 RepID=A0ABX2IM25_9RHOB|nr:META domain-containing protein [Sulfitobacter algicola]NSX53927.1 META domain-containing protein [Sulfitobacter algicola]